MNPQPPTSVSPHPSATSDAAKIIAARAQFPIVGREAYLNTGTNGPLPRVAYDAQDRQLRIELEEGRIGGRAFERYLASLDCAREPMARLLGCTTAEIALTHNTTEGLNIALMGLDWHPGDEIVTSRLEHTGGLYPIFLLRQRYGVRLRMTDIGDPTRDPVAELRAALSPRTRAVMLSHVSWATGMVLPMRALADLTHAANALLICDAAQSCGMLPAPVYDLGVDAYACSGQKWLCGPDGTGALFIRRDRIPEIAPTFMGYFSVPHGYSDDEGNFLPTPGAKRYEVATLSPSGQRGLAASLHWIDETIGWGWAFDRIAHLGRYCYDALARIDGVTMLTPRERMGGLIHFQMEGIAPEDLVKRVEAEHVIIRSTPSPAACRVSTGFFNTEDEIDHLVAAIGRARASA